MPYGYNDGYGGGMMNPGMMRYAPRAFASAPISDNPMGSFAGQFLNAFGGNLAQQTQDNRQLAQKEAYYKFLEQMLDKKLNANAPYNNARTNKVIADTNKTQMTTPSVNPTQVKQDELDYNMVRNAMADYSKTIGDVRKNASANFLSPEQTNAALTQASHDYFNDPAKQAFLPYIKHGADISGAIVQRNPTMKPLFNPQGQFIGDQQQPSAPQGAPQQAPPQGANQQGAPPDNSGVVTYDISPNP